jgi:hypothetical protein
LKKQNALLAGILFFEMHNLAPAPIFFLFFPLMAGGYHGIEEKKA